MWFYFIIALIASLLMSFYVKTNKKVFLILSFGILFFVSAFRYDIGYDYSHIYVKIFDIITAGGKVDWDIGTIGIIKLISLFTKDYLYFFIVMSFITMFFLFKSIRQYDKIAPILVFLLVCSGEYIASFNAVRQYVSIAIFMYSLKFIKEKNLKKYLIYMLCASLIHSSSVILIPIYFVNKIKPNVKNHLILLFLLVAILPFASSLFYSILGLTKYSHYINSNYNEFNPTYSELIMFSIVYVFCIFNWKKCKEDEDYCMFFNLTLVGLIISILSFKIILAYRIIFYFKMILFYTVGLIYRNINNAKNRLAFITLFIILFSSVTLIGAYHFGWYDKNYKSIIPVRWSK